MTLLHVSNMCTEQYLCIVFIIYVTAHEYCSSGRMWCSSCLILEPNFKRLLRFVYNNCHIFCDEISEDPE